MSLPGPIPNQALEHHVAFLGKTGSGKSNGAKVIVEDALDTGERVCVLDPTGAWWGLRLKRDGKPSKYPVVIFGGLHADVQIGREHGAAVAEVVATSSTPAVIDTRLMTVGERTAFFTEFAQTLLRKNRGPLRLVIDEAHVFAPQGRVADPRSGEMLHAANNLVSLGRSIGLRIMLLSQRPAKLHKDSLTQVETLVAMRLIAPQDRKAIEDWIGEWADKDQGKEIVASLPSLPTGDGWIWSPEIGFLERKHFPLARTYDSGKAPTGEEGAPELQPLKLDQVNALLEQAAAELKANDPRFLKSEAARLQRELAAALKSTSQFRMPTIDELRALNTPELVQLREQAMSEGFRRAAEALVEAIKPHLQAIRAAADNMSGISVEFPTLLRGSRAKAGAASAATSEQDGEAPVARPVSRPAGGRSPVSGRGPGAGAGASECSTLTGPQRQMLGAIAWWAAHGHPEPTKAQVAAIAGWRITSGHLKNVAGSLRTLRLIDYPQPGRFRLTEEGAAAAPEPDMGRTLHDSVREVLSGPQRTVFDFLLRNPGSQARDYLARACGWEPTSGHVKNVLGSMRTLEVIDYPVAGEVELQEWLR